MKKTKKATKAEDKLRLNRVFRVNNRALKLLFKRYPQMVISHFVSVAWNALTPYVGIFLSALVINELVGERNVTRLQTLVIVALASAALIALGTALLHKWRETQNTGWEMKVERILSEKMLDTDYVNLDDTHTAEMLSTIRQNLNGQGWGLGRTLECYEMLCYSGLTVFGGIALTVSLFAAKTPADAGRLAVLDHPLLVIGVIAAMLALTFLAPVLKNKAGSYYVEHASDHNLSNRLFSFFGWLGYYTHLAPDVRIYRQDKICERYNCDKEGTFSSKGVFARLSRGPIGLYNAAGAAVSVVFTGVVYAFVCLKALAGAFGLGSVTQYVAAVAKVSGGMSELVEYIGLMRNNTPFLELTFEYLDVPDNMYQGSLTVEKRNDRKYQIEFRNVSFKYPGREEYALRGVNMKFEIGKRLAVVGMNGSGKTTFIKLLCRLYDPTEGEILLNGIDIRKYNYREYMDIFSVVFQDFKLLALKLGENVAGRRDYDRERVVDCLKKAGFSDRLVKMENGTDTYLYKDFDENGVDVSGGEAQKIAIARALCKDAPFIILDEPTAALDPVAEADIYGKFDEIAGDKTAIYISHRLSSCKFCDEIAVFHEGAVIQQGSHASLVADTNGKYYELWHAQAQYYTETEKPIEVDA